jgi:hypothetical protein
MKSVPSVHRCFKSLSRYRVWSWSEIRITANRPMPSSRGRRRVQSIREYTRSCQLHSSLICRRLYSEKAYVLSRGFVKQALAFPPVGLLDEIRHYYYTTGHLKQVVDHAKALMEKETDMQNGDEGGSRWDADVIGSLTAGAKLSLKVCSSPKFK